jgi:nucleotide-binding universal stress UspA family protein
MLPFKRVLFPIDYSEQSEAIAPYVTEMVRRFSAQLTLVHAYLAEALALTNLPLSDPTLPEVVHCNELERIKAFGREHFPNQHVDTFVELGEAGSVIKKTVEHNGADLVMLPTHGRGPIRRFLLGSVAAKVLHDLDTPVWTSHALDHNSRIPYRSMLCALDDSDEAESVLKSAAALAHCYQAELHVVRVVDRPIGSIEADYAPCLDALMDAADFDLRELKGNLGLDVPHAVLSGSPSEEIAREASHRKTDLIVTGRGHIRGIFRPWAHLYQIVRESPCPVLSI